MMKKTHLLAGIATTIPFISLGNALLIPIAIIGSTAPDWDCFLGMKYHRTATHSLLALIISSVALAMFNWKLGLLWALNYTTHLGLDSITKMGVPIFYPFNKRYYGLKLIKTRGAEDMFICMLLLYLITVWLQ